MSNCNQIDKIEGSLKFITNIKCDSITPYKGGFKVTENQENFFILLILTIMVLTILVYWSSNLSQ